VGLASSLWPSCADGNRLDQDAVTAFLDTYRAASGPIPPDEDDLIVPLVRTRRVLEMLRAPTDRDPRWTSSWRACVSTPPSANNIRIRRTRPA
jgi:hypothetical protein